MTEDINDDISKAITSITQGSIRSLCKLYNKRFNHNEKAVITFENGKGYITLCPDEESIYFNYLNYNNHIPGFQPGFPCTSETSIHRLRWDELPQDQCDKIMGILKKAIAIDDIAMLETVLSSFK